MKCIGPKPGGCRSVDFHLGRSAWNSSRRCTISSSTRQGASLQEEETGHDVFLNDLARKGMKKEDELAKDGTMRSGPAPFRKKTKEELHAAFQCAAGCHCMVEEWYDCEELTPKPRET